jgi:aminopeptidase YwaD
MCLNFFLPNITFLRYNRKGSRIVILLLFLVAPLLSPAQDIQYARRVVDTLAAPGMHGRGYVNDGDKIAAAYIENEFKSLGLRSFDGSYRQEFTMNVNTFPERVNVGMRGIDKFLSIGEFFIVDPASSSISGKYNILWFDSALVCSAKKLKKFRKNSFMDKVLVIDKKGVPKDKLELFRKAEENKYGAAAVVVFNNKKLTWSVSQSVQSFAKFEFLVPDSLNKYYHNWKWLSFDVEHKFIPKYQTQNVIGYIPGSQYPDSFIVFSAHYDHLGRMGKDVYFPGANDNASGIAMLLNLAKHYSKPENKPKYSIAFMAFGAEEAGLVGSKYYTEHPLFPLKQIKFLINMDLAGTGDDGITVVNATEFKEPFNHMVKLNAQESLLKDVKPRGKAANSDHYFFTEKGVKAFFIYTMGGIKAYHDIYDRAETLPLTEFEDYFRLLTMFTAHLMK